MGKIKIITDSNSGITPKDIEGMDIFVIPMPFNVNGKEYLEGISLSQEDFYKLLKEDTDVTTSQPSAYYLQDLFETTLKEYDEIIYIPMTSGLSNTCMNAKAIAEAYNGKVHVIDNKRISIVQKTSVFEAYELLKQGKSADEIEEYLMSTSHIQSIYIYLETLKYLKKGGRCTPTAALLSNLLKIKPILYSRGEKFEKFNTCRTIHKAKEMMIEQIKYEIEHEFKKEYDEGLLCVSVAHTQNDEEAQIFKQEIMEALPKVKFNYIDPLSLSVSCHIGPGALAMGITCDLRNKL